MTGRPFLARLPADNASRDSSPPSALRADPEVALAFAAATLPIGPATFPLRALSEFAEPGAPLYNPPDRTVRE